jgi:hypothetical protein
MQNFRKWPTNYRIWIILLLLIVLIHSFSKGYVEFCEATDIKMGPWLFVFLFNQTLVKILFFLPLFLIFCDAPFVDANQPYVIIRSKRIAWNAGQVFYIILSTGIYFLAILSLSVILNLPQIEFMGGWGTVFNTLGGSDAARALALKSVFVSDRTLYYFSPYQAVWFTFLLTWLSGIFLGLTTYALNFASNAKSVGIAFSAFFLLLDAGFGENPDIFRVSPISWSVLEHIDIGNLTSFPSIRYIYAGFSVVIAALIAITFFVSKRQSINVSAPV